MSNYCCFIVPPHILVAMSESDNAEARQLATITLAHTHKVHENRTHFLAARLLQPSLHHGASGAAPGSHQQGIIPDYLTQNVVDAPGIDKSIKDAAARSLALSQQFRAARAEGVAGQDAPTAQVQRSVYDMRGKPSDPESEQGLPGTLVRKEGQDAVADKAVNEAFDSAGKVLEFYKQFFGYNSLDGEGMPIISSVHYSKDYGNAFWTSWHRQMVYGDGDKFIHNFTSCLDVIGHEMTHAVTEFNSQLQYQDEAGALNEHVSDAFGIMVKQFVEDTTADKADWLIGEGCLLPGVAGVALRNMKDPGTAYNDPVFGPDIQPDSYTKVAAVKKKYSKIIARDAGGVHIFSGIPNKAFATCAINFGGYTWEKAGKIWWTTVTTHRIPPKCKFIQFADATVDVAEELFGDDAAKIVRDAWTGVGVVRKH